MCTCDVFGGGGGEECMLSSVSSTTTPVRNVSEMLIWPALQFFDQRYVSGTENQGFTKSPVCAPGQEMECLVLKSAESWHCRASVTLVAHSW